MSEPTKEELAPLHELIHETGKYGIDAETFHARFDELLQNKLATLDPEWIRAMLKFYESSGSSRWYA